MVTAINDSSLTFERHETSIDHKHFKAVIQGMADVFLSGTANSSAIDHLSMAGKTGTAENPHGQDHSIFIGFVPIENPVIAVAVIVENGYWGVSVGSPHWEPIDGGLCDRQHQSATIVETHDARLTP